MSIENSRVMFLNPTTKNLLAKRRFLRWWGLSCLVSVMALTAGCSRVELVYDNADWLMYRWAVDLLDADPGQKQRWRGRFTELLSRHREQLLPDTLALLGEIESASRDGLDEARLNCLLDRTDALIKDHARLAVPIAVGILTELTPQQHESLAQRLAERNAEYVDNYLEADLDERRALRVERYTERVEAWVGRLSKAQRGVMADAIVQMPDTAEPWLAYRQQQQQTLLELLRRQAPEEELTEFLTAWWVDLEQRSAELVEAANGVRAQSIGLTLRIDASLDQRQRAGFSDRVAEWRSDLSSAQTLATTPPSVRCG
jgi:hypothetical protein